MPAWLAATTTVPAPVKVSCEACTVAGPLRTENDTPSPEVAVATRATWSEPADGAPGLAKLMVWLTSPMVIVPLTPWKV